MRRKLRPAPKDLLQNLKYRRLLLDAAADSKDLQQEIFSRCARDVVYFSDFALWTYSIKDFPSNPHRPFILWPYQERGVRTIMEHLGKADMSAEKTRDMGFSWTILAVFLHQWLFRDSQAFLIGSRKEEFVDKAGDAKSLFWKILYFLKHLPPWMRPPFTRTKLHLANNLNNSTIDGESTNEDFARGDRRVAILLDEAAAMPNGYEVISSAHYATNCCILGSTYKGTGGMFYEITQALKKESPDRVLRWHWTEHPIKSKGLCLKDGKPSSPWYEDACRRANYSRVEIGSEIDIDPAAAGDQFFDPDVLSKILKEMPLDPVFVGELQFGMDLKPRWVSGQRGRLEVWCPLSGDGKPPKGKYVIANDISAGTGGDTGSQSVASVYDAMSGELVAKLATNMLNPQRFGDYVVTLCNWFHGAYLAWERQGPGNQFRDQVMKECGYRYVYMGEDYDSMTRKKTRKPGWAPGRGKKADLIGAYREALFMGKIQNRSRKALEECREFVYHSGDAIHSKDKNAQEESRKGANHGDHVISDAIAWLAMQDIRPKETRAEAIVKERKPTGKPPRGSLAERMLDMVSSKKARFF